MKISSRLVPRSLSHTVNSSHTMISPVFCRVDTSQASLPYVGFCAHNSLTSQIPPSYLSLIFQDATQVSFPM